VEASLSADALGEALCQQWCRNEVSSVKRRKLRDKKRVFLSSNRKSDTCHNTFAFFYEVVCKHHVGSQSTCFCFDHIHYCYKC